MFTRRPPSVNAHRFILFQQPSSPSRLVSMSSYTLDSLIDPRYSRAILHSRGTRQGSTNILMGSLVFCITGLISPLTRWPPPRGLAWVYVNDVDPGGQLSNRSNFPHPSRPVPPPGYRFLLWLPHTQGRSALTDAQALCLCVTCCHVR